MDFLITKDFMNQIENAYFNDDEGALLQEMEDNFNDGFIQMDNIKQKLLNIKTDLQTNPSKIYATINAELKNLTLLNNKFDEFRKSVQDTNQKCIVKIKECQDHETQLKIEHIQVEENYKSMENKMNELRTDQDTGYRLHSGYIEYCAYRQEELKELDANITRFMFIASPVITMLVLTKSLQEGALAVIPLSGLVLGAFRYYTVQNLNKDYEMKTALKQTADSYEEEMINLSKPLRKNDIDVNNVHWMIGNETKKSKVFQEIVKVICNFQIIIRKWQEPLDSIIIIFEVNNFSTTPPKLFIERYQRSLKNDVEKIMKDAAKIYTNQTFSKIMLPVTVVKINRALPAYEFRERCVIL